MAKNINQKIGEKMKLNQKQHITRRGVVKKNPSVKIYELTTNQKDGFAKWNVRGIKTDEEAKKIALQGFGKKYFSPTLIAYLDDYPSKYGTDWIKNSLTISEFIKKANEEYGVKEKDEEGSSDDLYLKDLAQYYGTEGYHKVSNMFSSNVTDGIIYIMKNGYSWFVTDMLVIIEKKLRGRDNFFAIKLKVNGTQAIATIEDGNGKVYHRQEYKYTNAKKDLTLYWRDDVLMLSGEY